MLICQCKCSLFSYLWWRLGILTKTKIKMHTLCDPEILDSSQSMKWNVHRDLEFSGGRVKELTAILGQKWIVVPLYPLSPLSFFIDCTLFNRLPRLWLYFPLSLPTRCSFVTRFWKMGYNWRDSVSWEVSLRGNTSVLLQAGMQKWRLELQQPPSNTRRKIFTLWDYCYQQYQPSAPWLCSFFSRYKCLSWLG